MELFIVSLIFIAKLASSQQNQQAGNINLQRNELFIKHLLEQAAAEVASQQASNKTAKMQPNTIDARSLAAAAGKQNSSIKHRWLRMESALGESVQLLGVDLKSTIDKLLSQAAVSQGCQRALASLSEALMKQQLWAAKFLDSSATRIPSGFFEGTLTELGNFDQCLTIGETQTAEHTAGQYCSLQIKPLIPSRPRLHTVCQRLTAPTSVQANSSAAKSRFQSLLAQNINQFHYAGLRLGVCMPSKCSKLDIQALLSSYLTKFELMGTVKSCQIGPASTDFLESLDSSQQCIA